MTLGESFDNISDPAPVAKKRQVIGRSDLLGR
jgi:hypothetical protein